MSDLKILLIRHPVSQWNKEAVHQGQSPDEPGLAEEGREQALRLADHLKGKPLLAIWHSPLPRTTETVVIINERLSESNILSIPDRGLMEITHGIADGMHFTKIKEQFPKEWENMESRIWTDEPLFPRGEAPVQASKRKLRAQYAIARIAHRIKISSQQNEDGVIVVVAHGAVNSFFLCEITGTPIIECWEKFPQDNACINTIIWDEKKGEFTIESVNETSYLGDLRYSPLIKA